MAGMDPRLGRQGHQPLHDRVHLVGVARRPAAAGAADGALEEAVRRQAVGTADEEREMTGAMAGCCDRADLEPPRRRVAVTDQLVDRNTRVRRLAASDGRHAEPLREARDVDDMVAVLVCDEDVGDRQPARRNLLQQRPLDAVRVDQNAMAAVVLGDQIRVRRPGRMLDSLDDHARILRLPHRRS